jgi:hypothetical protein
MSFSSENAVKSHQTAYSMGERKNQFAAFFRQRAGEKRQQIDSSPRFMPAYLA